MKHASPNMYMQSDRMRERNGSKCSGGQMENELEFMINFHVGWLIAIQVNMYR